MGVKQGDYLVAAFCGVFIVSCCIPTVFSQGSEVLMPIRERTDMYPFVTVMDYDGEYILRWNFTRTHITFEVQANTTGYVAFGISESGMMYPADVFIGYIANNNVYYGDFHTIGYERPVRDASEDWTILYGFEENGWTVLGFSRPLDTCDADDIAITRNTARLIWAYGSYDPADFASLQKHTRMGRKSVSLLTPPRPPVQLPNDITPFYFLNDNYTISAGKSGYRCRGFTIPPDLTKLYIIKTAPILSPETRHLIGHMALYRCVVQNPSQWFTSGDSFHCMTDAPRYLRFCREYVAGFGFGKDELYLPDDVAIPIGGPGEPNVYVLATYYYEPDGVANLVDNSGIELTVTSVARTHEAAYLSMGNIISQNWVQFIPPGDSDFLQRAYCSMKCLAWGNGDCKSGNPTPMTVAGVQYHSHSLGKAMKLRHFTYDDNFRATENPWLDYDNYFDYEQLAFRELKERRRVSCKDELLLECSYDSSRKEVPTKGGWSELDELCRAYVLYYPKKHIEGCMSWSNYDQLRGQNGARVSANSVFRTLYNVNWKAPGAQIMRRNLKISLERSNEHGQCWSSRRNMSYAFDYFSQPAITNKYREPRLSTCP